MDIVQRLTRFVVIVLASWLLTGHDVYAYTTTTFYFTTAEYGTNCSGSVCSAARSNWQGTNISACSGGGGVLCSSNGTFQTPPSCSSTAANTGQFLITNAVTCSYELYAVLNTAVCPAHTQPSGDRLSCVDECPSGQWKNAEGSCQPIACVTNETKYARYTLTLCALGACASPPNLVTQFCRDGCLMNVATSGRFDVQLGSQTSYGQSGIAQEDGATCPGGLKDGSLTSAYAATQGAAGTAAGDSIGASTNGTGSLTADQAGKLTGIYDNTKAGGPLEEKLAVIADQTKADIAGGGGLFDCQTSLICTGDAARCAMVEYQKQHYCNTKATSGAELTTISEALSNVQNTTDAQFIDQLKEGGGTIVTDTGLSTPRWLSSGSCPTLPPVEFLAHSFTFDLAPMCSIAPMISLFLLAGTGILCARIVGGAV